MSIDAGALVRLRLWAALVIGLMMVAQAAAEPPLPADALPDGAVARVGSTRWRPGGWVWAMAWSPAARMGFNFRRAAGSWPFLTKTPAAGRMARFSSGTSKKGSN